MTQWIRCARFQLSLPGLLRILTCVQQGSMSKALDTWVSHNAATGKFHFNGNINQDIRDHLSGANGKAAAEFGKSTGVWNTFLDDYFVQKLRKTGAEVKDFDTGLMGMLFGKGKTYILMFQAGFLGEVDNNEITLEDHPLYKVEHGKCDVRSVMQLSAASIQSFGFWFSLGAGGVQRWLYIERGSTLCFYDSRYFFLKFRRPGETEELRVEPAKKKLHTLQPFGSEDYQRPGVCWQRTRIHGAWVWGTSYRGFNATPSQFAAEP
ncbi:hypothetical protein DFH08DRAFT_1034510 [Mycena albidolilacea]|uniref:Uncharacterized protein n=1 Tax=Mycena albidolilacea TaxID=1033008 RepID=A0AAD6ZFI9_9AGAR|nr:hypothetical protein DFH08DRAFT_1034510 [Mycena albidolilacea]